MVILLFRLGIPKRNYSKIVPLTRKESGDGQLL